MVGPGEEVTLVREPHNQYDSNAIQVVNISGTQVGHIPRNVASKLAPLIDRNYVTIEGELPDNSWNAVFDRVKVSSTMGMPTDSNIPSRCDHSHLLLMICM